MYIIYYYLVILLYTHVSLVLVTAYSSVRIVPIERFERLIDRVNG